MTLPITFHLPGSALRDPSRLAPFYQRLMDGLAATGARVETCIHDRPNLLDRVEATPGFHIVDHGSQRHPRLLNTGVAYIYPFWNCDPWGIRALSSIAAKPFDPARIDPDRARHFADRLRQRLVGARKSRYDQPPDHAVVPKGCIAVFLQAESHRGTAETCHLSLRQMITALTQRDDPRPIVIKPHPLDSDTATRTFLTRIARADPRISVMDANLHDILSAASVTVTINSAVGMESMLHRVPVVLCGQSDFHHAALTARSPDELHTQIVQTAALSPRFDDFLFWYFHKNCLNSGKPSLVSDLLRRIAATGFDPAAICPPAGGASTL